MRVDRFLGHVFLQFEMVSGVSVWGNFTFGYSKRLGLSPVRFIGSPSLASGSVEAGRRLSMVIVVFGVTGTGKTRVGSALAEALGWMFIDADDFHEEANRTKLRRGIALNDEDRRPWLTRLRGIIQESLTQRRNTVLACSALKRAYRRYLRVGPEVVFVYLRTETHVLEERLRRRRGHFANPVLLQSQLETLEEPLDDTLTVDTADSPVKIVDLIRETLKL
jgi:gluconokinase